jgi:ubiquinone/menaquinone biosynthesis C-methylase UbiE
MAHKFDPKQVHKLDDPERSKTLPPEKTLDLFGIEPGMTLVDLGAGSCFFALPTARRVGPEGKVYAVDIHQELLDLCGGRAAEQGMSNLELVLAQETVVPLPSEIADAVLLVNVLHEFEDARASLLEVGRLLRPGGRLLVVDWKKEEMEMGPPLHARFTPEEAGVLLEAGGFAVQTQVEPGPLHYGLICLRTPSPE